MSIAATTEDLQWKLGYPGNNMIYILAANNVGKLIQDAGELQSSQTNK